MAIETALLQTASGDPDIVYTARQLRNLILGGLFSREGVRDKDAGELRVGQRGAGANMSVDVAVGRAAVFGDDASDQGTYSINSNTVVNVAIPAASSSAARTHRVILRVRDKLENSSWSTYDTVVQVQADTAANATLPASAIALASVTTPASATSVTNAMITDLRPSATVGTPARTGSIAAYGGWYGSSTNLPRYSVTPDGLVLLSGVIYRGAASFTATGTTYYEFATLPAAVRPAAGRLVPMLAQGFRQGIAQLNTDGIVKFAFQTDQTVTKDQFWISLDGLAYRIGE